MSDAEDALRPNRWIGGVHRRLLESGDESPRLVSDSGIYSYDAQKNFKPAPTSETVWANGECFLARFLWAFLPQLVVPETRVLMHTMRCPREHMRPRWRHQQFCSYRGGKLGLYSLFKELQKRK